MGHKRGSSEPSDFEANRPVWLQRTAEAQGSQLANIARNGDDGMTAEVWVFAAKLPILRKRGGFTCLGRVMTECGPRIAILEEMNDKAG